MRLPLLASLALLVAAPAQAVLALGKVSQPADTGVHTVELASVSIADGPGLALRGVERSVGLSFGDRALPRSPADDHLLAADTWRHGAGNHRDAVAPGASDSSAGRSAEPAAYTSIYSSAMAEPAGWAVVAAALVTLLGLLGLRRRAH